MDRTGFGVRRFVAVASLALTVARRRRRADAHGHWASPDGRVHVRATRAIRGGGAEVVYRVRGAAR